MRKQKEGKIKAGASINVPALVRLAVMRQALTWFVSRLKLKLNACGELHLARGVDGERGHSEVIVIGLSVW